ncbi:MAG TPA: NADH-quinone oxidoreductase subunit N [Solirubrobacterales bacterium]|nr:NADH-quinone oxidoreductase subunit N [Solirubrobacterales bacterium]HMU27288.1 NADH-quinone oxidoreductase subunit N [Solirubrobacterales bacterium]HMX71013.1 NADH-quinone oxidoreductase subunit N [Solirubrobacterales bacterium]HNA43777.1 NADH-quinone oxidoreductase subunit N [Solirubrobacterales bacterium]HNC04836.1 NADH-quinone oxidoreductase subunit N [Solirubrobacterales bacterium]
MSFDAPAMDYAGLSPVIALTTGLVVIVLASVFDSVKRFGPFLALLTFAVTAGCLIWQWSADIDLVSGSLRLDGLAATLSILVVIAAAVSVLLAIGDPSETQAGRSDWLALLTGSVLGMVILAQATSMLTFFVGLELLSIPLYALCGTNLRRRESLESGLKYLIVGSVGSATLLYGLAMIYGASGATGFQAISDGLQAGDGMLSDSLTLVGVGLVAVGLAFKVSIAPFHQWTPDVYQGAPTPVTAFMAVATKAAAFAVFIRFFLVALGPLADQWDVMLAALAALSIVVGNVGALAQTSLKRMLGYSGIAQAGYMLAGIVTATQAGVDALVFYLAAYVAMNVGAFAVVVARERQTGFSDDISTLRGLGREKPLLAWPLTISMLALAGLPPTVGFIGKLYLIEALVDDDWTWLAVMIAIGTMISLGYYLRVVATVWMSPAEESEAAAASIDTAALPPQIAGAQADPFTDSRADRRWYLVAPALIAMAAALFFGVIPQPLVDFAQHAGNALSVWIS